MAAISEGKDRSTWRHTLLLYAAGFTKNPSTFKMCYPYQEDFRTETTKEAHAQSVQALKSAILGRTGKTVRLDDEC
jgi:hypothetical protein